ncbi:MAG: hypothetical protein R2716_11605 [Microthrixaceae bacterium]
MVASTSGCRHPTATPGRWRELAERLGVVGSPGEFYGPDAATHLRLAMVRGEEALAAVARRAGI